MKKILAMVLVGVIGMSIFTGCGKSEEEKAMDEIAGHLRDEAAQDGVDLEAEMQADAEKYNAELEAGNKANEDRNEFIESLKNNEMVPLKEQYEIYSSATDSDTAKKAGEEFNTAYDKYLTAAIGEHIIDEDAAAEQLRQNDIYNKKLTDNAIQTRVNYLDNCYGKNYNKIQFFEDDNENICMLLWNETDDQIVSDVMLVYQDGKTLIPNLSAIGDQVQSVEFVVNSNSLIITNYTWAYEFTTDNSVNSIGNEDGSPIFPEGDYRYKTELWENTIEEYNSKME